MKSRPCVHSNKFSPKSNPSSIAAFAESGFTEITRELAPGKYTYWDYQKLRFPKNEGMRIDFAYTTPSLARRVQEVWIDRNERKGKGASDHVPVVLEVALDAG